MAGVFYGLRCRSAAAGAAVAVHTTLDVEMTPEKMAHKIAESATFSSCRVLCSDLELRVDVKADEIILDSFFGTHVLPVVFQVK